MEGEASYAEISNFLIFQKPIEQLEDMQYKGRIGASQAKQHKKMRKLAAQKNPIKLQAEDSAVTQT